VRKVWPMSVGRSRASDDRNTGWPPWPSRGHGALSWGLGCALVTLEPGCCGTQQRQGATAGKGSGKGAVDGGEWAAGTEKIEFGD